MSKNAKDRARVSVEVLEGRQLPSAHITAALGGLAPATVTTQSTGKMSVDYGKTQAGHTSGATYSTIAVYAVFSLRNRTGAPLSFQFRWTDQSGWTSYSLPARGALYFWSTASTGTAQVRFNGPAASHTTPFTLTVNKVAQNAPPIWTDAAHYTVTHPAGTFAVSPSAS
jgi:hypothetical protein